MSDGNWLSSGLRRQQLDFFFRPTSIGKALLRKS
jgi:hypothetical protein